MCFQFSNYKKHGHYDENIASIAKCFSLSIDYNDIFAYICE